MPQCTFTLIIFVNLYTYTYSVLQNAIVKYIFNLTDAYTNMESGKYLVKKGDPTAWESISRLGHMIQGLPDALFDEVKTGEYIFNC